MFEIAACRADTREIWLALATLREGAGREEAVQHLLTRFEMPAGTHVPPWVTGWQITAERREFVEACVREEHGGIAGWAWHPADPDRLPVLVVEDDVGHRQQIVAEGDMQPLRPLTQPRGFALGPDPLADWGPVVHVRDAFGRDLPGSPVVRGAIDAPPPKGKAIAKPLPAAPNRPVCLVIPAYRDAAALRACLDSIRSSNVAAEIIIVDDASPEPMLQRMLNRLARRGEISLIRHAHNRGFPISANDGLRAVLARREPHDVVLLNADTLLPSGKFPTWLERLRAAVHSAPDIASATPLSNAGGITSYPARDRENPMPSATALARLNTQAARANAGVVVALPTGVGFCLYLRHEALVETGLLREDLFAQGYGEENDWCRRAAALGWRHVAAADVLVGHQGAASFGASREALMARNLAVLEAVHPGYGRLVHDWAGRVPAEDGLAAARRALDLQRWQARPTPRTTLLVTHASGGGVERIVQARAAEIIERRGRVIILRPLADPQDRDGAALPGWCVVQDAGDPDAFPNLAYRLPDEAEGLSALLRGSRVVAVEYHHRLGHHSGLAAILAALDVPISYVVHDYAELCPRITFLGPQHHYCGEPTDPAVCADCVAVAGERNLRGLDVMSLRESTAREWRAAHQVSVPSGDTAGRVRRHVPDLDLHIARWEDDTSLPVPPPPRRILGETVVAVIGAISIDKGFEVLRDCADDAAQRNLPLRFRVVGQSQNDDALFATGRVFVTGRFREDEAESLIRAQNASLAFLPSVVPETWSFALSHAWRAGLRAMVFDLGAMAGRTRRTGFGWVIPLGLPVSQINDLLLTCGEH